MGTSVEEINVATLRQLLLERNPLALQYLYEYAPRLELSLRTKFGAYVADEDLEDIVVDTLLHAYETRHRFDPAKSQIATWLNQLAHYQALTFIRKHRKTKQVSLDTLSDKLAAAIEQRNPDWFYKPSPAVEQFLPRLPDLYEEVLRLHYYNGLSAERIAQLLNVKPGTVRTRLSRARMALQQLIEEDRQQDDRWASTHITGRKPSRKEKSPRNDSKTIIEEGPPKTIAKTRMHRANSPSKKERSN